MIYQVLLIVQYVSIPLLLLEAGYIFVKWRTRLQGFLFFNVVATLVNNLGYLMQMKSESYNEYLMSLQVSYAGRIWIPFSLFVFTMLLSKVKIGRKYMLSFALFHMLTYLSILFAEWVPLYYTSMNFIAENPITRMECGRGILYLAHFLAILGYIGFGSVKLILAVRAEKRPKAKKQLKLIMVTIIIEAIFYVVQLTGVTGGYDITVLGYTIGAVFMYVAIFRYDLLDALQLAGDVVMDDISEAIVAVNDYGDIEYFNAPAKAIFPHIAWEGERVLEKLNRALKEENKLHLGERIYSISERKLYNQNAESGVAYVLADDTERLYYIEELREQKRIAEDANASKSAFLSIVTHEIRTPMNAVVGMTELLLRDEASFSDKQVEYLQNIKNSGASLVMIVNDILDHSKLEAGKMELVDAPYELAPLVEDVRLIIENRIGTKPIKLICEIGEKVPDRLIGDALRIRQILINLLNNAVKFTAEGFIKLTITYSEDYSTEKTASLRFSIQDSGQGIREEDLARLGEAFTQVDTGKNHDKEGTGLGLSISKDFIQMMGGQLEVKSEYGHGTEFYFMIAQKLPEKDEISEVIQESAPEQFVAPDARILIVDDIAMNAMIAEEILEPLGMQIDAADSGEKAIEMILDNHYDFVFMDYMMPYMDGVQTTQRIRGMAKEYAEKDAAMAEYLSKLPIIALSGDSSEETRTLFADAGINDFTDKPVTFEKLVPLLKKWLPEALVQLVKEEE